MADLHLDLTKTAVLAMDFQQKIVTGNAMARERNVVPKVRSVLVGARRAGLTVIHVIVQFRPGYPEVSSRNRMFSGIKQSGLFVVGHNETIIDNSLGPAEGDIVVGRPRMSGFYCSDLQAVLSAKEVNTLVMMGISTEWVVESTVRHAVDADYRAIVLEDCCAGMSVEAHNIAMTYIFTRIAEVSTSEEFLANLK